MCIQYVGVVLGYGGGVGYVYKNFFWFYVGYLNRIVVINNYSVVIVVCLLVKCVYFDIVYGLNEKNFFVVFNDVDFCLKVKSLGVQNVYCVEVEFFYYELVSRGLDILFEKVVCFN